MAFVASLLAYLASITGIVLAFAMSYAVLFHPQSSQPTPASAKIETALKGSTAAADARMPAQSTPTMLRWRRAASEQAWHSGVAAKARGSVRRRTFASRERQRAKHALPQDFRAHARQWAYQQPPDGSLFGLYDRQSFDNQ
jgi:hypothetical protein